MQRLIILLFISLTSNFVIAQQAYFSERYNFSGAEVIFSVLEVDTGYLCGVGTNGVMLMFLDKEGNKLVEKNYSKSGAVHLPKALHNQESLTWEVQ